MLRQMSLRIFDQAFKNRRVREELRTSIGHKGFVQAIIGIALHSAPCLRSPLIQPTNGDDFESDTNFPSRFPAG